jgi:CRISPR-associated protein Csb2
MYDVWQRKRRHLTREQVRSLFAALASAEPRFHLPGTVTASHTRSYLSSNTEDPKDKSLIFDAFVALPLDASCFIEWPVQLAAGQMDTLGELLSGLNYLGRSESWIDARISGGLKPGLSLCVPSSSGEMQGEPISLACPIVPAQYSGKRDWFDALAYSTGDLIKERRSDPPAMRNVSYQRERNAVVAWMSSSPHQRELAISGVVLALDGRVLPMATETIRVAERVRSALMSVGPRDVSPILKGKDEAGRPLQNHKHLFILPQADRQGRIDRVLLFLRQDTLRRTELETILRLNRLHPFDGAEQDDPAVLRVAVSWAGRRDSADFRPGVREVVSATPFVPTRFWRRGRGDFNEFLREEVRLECRHHGLPEPERIEPARMDSLFPWIRFRRSRKNDVSRPGYSFRIRFKEPVPAPFSLGYGCHFGLGQFRAADR